MDTVDKQIEKAKRLVQSGNEPEAEAIADELLRTHPTVLAVRMLRGYLASLKGDHRSAIFEYDHALAIAPNEPHLFMERGLNYLEVRESDLAATDFSEGLRLCDVHNNDYYRSTLHFLRAEAHLLGGQKQLALLDLSHLEDGFKSWSYRLRTKEEMISECSILS
jgi:tetratricopeptide (TPR) repeat protein